MSFSRRTALKGLGAAAISTAVAGPARAAPVAWTEAPAFTAGPLATDKVGRAFRAPAGETPWPDSVPLLGPAGPLTLAAWRGKTLLVALWAEWCAPCLAEMPALAGLNRVYRSRTFEILPILSGSHALRTQAEARERLARLKGVDITTLADGSGDRQALMQALAQSKLPPEIKIPPGATVTNTSLPCLLVVDAAGRVRGRTLGLPTYSDGKNSWETPAGEGFIRLLAGGALEPLGPARTAV